MCRRRPQCVAWAALAAISLASCAVGPDFKRPEAPPGSRYTDDSMPATTAASDAAHGNAQQFTPGGELKQQWWTLFRSEPLDRLIDQALLESPTVAAAQATLRQAQQTLAAERGLTWPNVSGQFNVQREQFSAASLGQPGTSIFTLYNTAINVSYPVDLFGSIRRQLEALRAQTDNASFQLQATYLTLTANLATTAIREASLRAQIRATEDIEKLQQDQLQIVERRFNLGAVTKSDVLSQRTALAQTRATLPGLQRQLSQLRHQLSLYAGRTPESAGLPSFELDGLELPLQLPVSVPSALVRQRPDILSAEALLHAASAQVGVATANLYPQLTLSGNVGSEAVGLSQLFTSNATVWTLGGGLLAPIFSGGQLQANRRAAVAAFDAAAANYRQTVLTAFANVADALRALQTDALALQAQVEAQHQAREAFNMASYQFNVGGTSYLTLLNAQQQLQQTRIAVVQAQADRFADTVALFQALGGGWWNGPAPGAAGSTSNAGPTVAAGATDRDSSDRIQ
ncbi:MAG TPA: efflux transporter outer membrane subunit [Burkholderiaceae bacterium]|nr:efflux transporter outer membrane subunit [Burkholderiaceae bacterium]